MVTQEAIDYIKAQLLAGANKEAISGALQASGWGQSDVEEAFRTVLNIPTVPPAPPAPPKQPQAVGSISATSSVGQPESQSGEGSKPGFSKEQVDAMQRDWVARHSDNLVLPNHQSAASAQPLPQPVQQNAPESAVSDGNQTAQRPRKKRFRFGKLLVLLLIISAGILYLNKNALLTSARPYLANVPFFHSWVREQDLTTLRRAIIRFNGDNLQYPGGLEDLNDGYLIGIPSDPVTKKPYNYTLSEDGKDFTVCVPDSSVIQCMNEQGKVGG
jgi:hypothetical protein